MDRFVVEAERRVVGIAVRVPGGFRFVASDPDFYSMDRKIFRRTRLLVSRVAELGRALRATGREARAPEPVARNKTSRPAPWTARHHLRT